MSRIVTIKSTAEIVELDLAEEVVAELRAKGKRNLSLDKQAKRFTNRQDEDFVDNTLAEAEQLYGIKVQQRRKEQVVEKLKAAGYKQAKVVTEGDKIKIIAKQYVYA